MATWFKATINKPPNGDALDVVAGILKSTKDLDQYAYERDAIWYLGVGHRHSLVVDASGNSATTNSAGGKPTTETINKDINNAARKFYAEYSNRETRIFGQAAFNYAAATRGLDFKVGKWPLLLLMVPRVQIIVQHGRVEITALESEPLAKTLHGLIKLGFVKAEAEPQVEINTGLPDNVYTDSVLLAQEDMAKDKYEKVILSRAVQVQGKVDIISTLVRGRLTNSPKRAYLVNQAGFQAVGFSPELVMRVQDKVVSTEPLAGTRACGDTDEERINLRHELLRDPKEVVEHVISVREAIKEIDELADEGTTAVYDFMTVRIRGRVQHLGSRVSGYIRDDKDGWDALKVLFPSITASGIPKQESLKAIMRLEPSSRELYSGSILMIKDETDFEGTLVLRTVYQNGRSSWVQAGAGIIDQSKPEREYTETREKLSTIAPFVVLE